MRRPDGGRVRVRPLPLQGAALTATVSEGAVRCGGWARAAAEQAEASGLTASATLLVGAPALLSKTA